MSLIERAINRLGKDGNPIAAPVDTSAQAPDQPAAAAPSEQAGSDGMQSAGWVPSPSAPTTPVDVAPGVADAVPASFPSTAGAVTEAPPALQINPAVLASHGHAALESSGRISHEFRVIKRPLVSNAFGANSRSISNGKRVMITSALPGEGKSFCAINLALSIAAERDTSVLLVDADVAKPSLPHELGIPDGPGLMDWLVDPGVDIARLVSPTSIEKLSVMTAGTRHALATEYLASAAMSRLLDLLSARYPDRMLIFDSPPLLPTTEARVLAHHMGQIVMVIEAGQTDRHAVSDALATIQSCEVVTLLLNKARRSGARAGNGQYGYGYGYGYGAPA